MIGQIDMKENDIVHDDQYWYEKAKADFAEPEPRHEDQDKEYGKGESPDEKNNLVDLTGHWFVNFGADLETAKIEGSRIITLNGTFDVDHLITILVEHIQDSLPQNAKEILKQDGNNKIVIRAFNRMDNPLNIGVRE